MNTDDVRYHDVSEVLTWGNAFVAVDRPPPNAADVACLPLRESLRSKMQAAAVVDDEARKTLALLYNCSEEQVGSELFDVNQAMQVIDSLVGWADLLVDLGGIQPLDTFSFMYEWRAVKLAMEMRGHEVAMEPEQIALVARVAHKRLIMKAVFRIVLNEFRTAALTGRAVRFHERCWIARDLECDMNDETREILHAISWYARTFGRWSVVDDLKIVFRQVQDRHDTRQREYEALLQEKKKAKKNTLVN
jgi:hypothetical protein